MRFDLHLDVPATIPSEEHAVETYHPELDDVTSILRDVCASLADLPGVKFVVAVGAPMPVSVRRDLVVVMEQLCDALTSLRAKGLATLDLYEQGIEAQLVFAVEGELMRIERRDLLGRSKPSCEIHLARETAVESMRVLARTFVDAAMHRCPKRTAHPWFADWAQLLLTATNQ